MLSNYGRALEATELGSSVADTKSNRKKKHTTEGPAMKQLTITKPNVTYVDAGKTHRPEVGAVVSIGRLSVAESLVRGGLAVEGRSIPQEHGPTVAGEAIVAAVEEAPSEGPSGAVPVPVATWDDISLSETSYPKLMRNAPGANPYTVTEKEVIEWLEGSTRQATYVMRAIASWKATFTGDAGEDE